MSMQDKEFDELFRTSFKNFEVQPSRGLWNSIADKMDSGKRRNLIVRLSIAACLLLAASAGLYFLADTPEKTEQQVAVIKHQNKPEPVNSLIAEPENIITKPVGGSIAAVRTPKPIAENIETIKRPKPVTEPITIDEPGQDEQLAQVQPHREVLKAVVPDVDIPLTTKPDLDEPVSVNNIATLAPAETTQRAKVLAAAPVKKRRIRSLGDIVNAVVGKIDKRKDKLIEFTTNDDEDAVLTGVNLGLVRIKKEK